MSLLLKATQSRCASDLYLRVLIQIIRPTIIMGLGEISVWFIILAVA